MWELTTLSLKNEDSFKAQLFSSEESAVSCLSSLLKEARDDCLLRAIPAKRLKGIFFDMDDTLLEGESLVHLAEALGKKVEVEEMTRKAMEGKLNFRDSVEKRLKIFDGFTLEHFQEISDKFRLHRGAANLLENLQMWGIRFYLVSGGFREWIPEKLRDVPFSGVCINRLDIGSTGHIQGKGFLEPLIDGRAKAEFVANEVRKNGWGRDEFMVVGDGANDLEMMKLCQTPVGFRAKPVLYPHLRGNIQSGFDFLSKLLATDSVRS